MVFLLLLDVIASSTLYITLKCGEWVLSNTAHGLYYIYKKIIYKPEPEVHSELLTDSTIHHDDDEKEEEQQPQEEKEEDGEFVVLTRDEYDRLKMNAVAAVDIQ
jgi:hypothetical protein